MASAYGYVPMTVAWLAAILISLTACGGDVSRVETDIGHTSDAVERTEGSDKKSGVKADDPADLIAGQSLIDAKYKVTVHVMGIGTCDGEANLKLNANFGKGTDAAAAQLLELSGTLNCPLLGCQMDLAQMVGGAAGAPPGASESDPLVVKDSVMHLKQLGLSKFSPPRPFFPAFLSARREDLDGLYRSVELRATDLTDGTSGEGSVTLKMLGFGESYDAKAMGRTFSDSMTFELKTEGFDGMNKIKAVLFDRLEFALSVKPLALLHIAFEGPVSDLLAAQAAAGGQSGGCGSGAGGGGAGGALGGLFGGGAGGGLGGLFGGGGGGGLGALMGGPLGQLAKQLFLQIINVNMRADLVSMKGVDPNEAADSDDLGEVIGGNATEE
jgi:hypothetical protein